MKQPPLISIMLEVGIALHGGGDPFRVLRLAKNRINPGSPLRRGIESILKQDKAYLEKAVDVLANQ